MLGVTYAGAKIDVGPILEWSSPDDAVAWLRENVLAEGTWLAQMEAAKKWAWAVSRDPAWMLTKADADIIVEFVRLGQSEAERKKLAAQVVHLRRTLDRPARSARSLYDSVDRVSKSATGTKRLSLNMMQAATRYVHLGRRWPR